MRKDFACGIENVPKLISSTKAGTISTVELVTSLQTLGANRYVSNIIAHMANLKNKVDISFKEIELATGLRQPEVSLGVQELRKKGWISESEIKREGKGRPTNLKKIFGTN